MRNITTSAFAAGLLLSLSVGCSQNSQVMRGQSPLDPQVAPGPVVGGPVANGGYPAGTGGAPYCPPGADGYGGDGYFGAGFGDSAYVRGRHFCPPTSYNMYPPPNDVPAVVQYPYYTTKGPDDFFLE